MGRYLQIVSSELQLGLGQNTWGRAAAEGVRLSGVSEHQPLEKPRPGPQPPTADPTHRVRHSVPLPSVALLAGSDPSQGSAKAASNVTDAVPRQSLGTLRPSAFPKPRSSSASLGTRGPTALLRQGRTAPAPEHPASLLPRVTHSSPGTHTWRPSSWLSAESL